MKLVAYGFFPDFCLSIFSFQEEDKPVALHLAESLTYKQPILQKSKAYSLTF